MILVRTDAKASIALGHLKRCVSLAQKLRGKGSSLSFLTVEDGYTRRCLQDLGYDHSELEPGLSVSNDCHATMEKARMLDTRIVIVDSYEIDRSYLDTMVENGFFVVLIDDGKYTATKAQCVVNGCLNARVVNYEVPEDTSLLLGIDYLLLGERYENTGAAGVDLDEVKNVLITMGGIDHYDMTTKILKVLDTFSNDFSVTVIVGPYYSNGDSIKAQADCMQREVRLVESPDHLFDYMKECSLAFCAGGQTVYELAALGRPTVGIGLWNNQMENVNELSRIGVMLPLIYSDDEAFDLSLENTASQLMQDASMRKNLSDAALKLVDGAGCERVSDQILKSYNQWKEGRYE